MGEMTQEGLKVQCDSRLTLEFQPARCGVPLFHPCVDSPNTYAVVTPHDTNLPVTTIPWYNTADELSPLLR